jgi:hypothetical protein
MARNAIRAERVERASLLYQTLVTQIGMDGHVVEAYQLPFVLDERRAGATLLQRSLGLVDLAVDREVLMVYSSFVPSVGPGLLWSYGMDVARRRGGLAVGITGGGVDVGQVESLTWDELVRDLQLAARLSDHVYIFSLEGCVAQDTLARLATVDWAAPAAAPGEAARRVDRVRRLARAVLWASAHPSLLLAGAAAVLLWLWQRRRRR